ncbi:MAG: glycosyltransferase family 4 protein [Nitrospinota bacterium]|nr:glycosyltransferase family 4 protein [Nitrospinota bacterium]
MMPDEKVRVLIIIARMNVGGPAWLASALADGLPPGGFETLLVCGHVGDDEADYLEMSGEKISMHRIDALGRSIGPLGDLKSLFEIRKVIKKFNPHIVHTHTAKAGFLGRLAAFSMRVPVVVHTFHGHLLYGYFSNLTVKGICLIEKVLAKFSNSLVAVGEKVRDDLLSVGIGDCDKFEVIVPGVEAVCKMEKVSIRKKLGLHEDQIILLFVGRLTKIKRLDRLLEAVGLLKDDFPNLLLLVAGGGDLEDSVREMASDLGSSVKFLGWQEDVFSLYFAADVVVLSSDNEGMPVSLIEAAIAGLPAVTTDAGSAREVVVNDKTGLVVEKSSMALSQGLRLLFADKKYREEMGQEAQKHAIKSFSKERLITDHLELYRKLIASKN